MKTASTSVKHAAWFLAGFLLVLGPARVHGQTDNFIVVDTGQIAFYDTSDAMPAPLSGQPFYGQDAHYAGNQPNYIDNGDGTVTDLNTGLMWQQTYSGKMTWGDALADASTLSLAGHNDWRLPSIKELYSLIDFSGIDPSGWPGTDTSILVPFIDRTYFDFAYGDTGAGERIIDAQYWSSTEYVSTTMGGFSTTFGVNFADGRIKGYGRTNPLGGEMTQFVRYVRGNPSYGVNNFVDNGDGTVTDLATGLRWMQADSAAGYDWENALAYCENLSFAGHNDWRLPDAKDLQGIVDYTRSPATTGSAAIDPVFSTTAITDESGATNYPFYWAGTTHVNMTQTPGRFGTYVAFGEALGWMEQPPNSGNYVLQDVHGAGAQRSDPKTGSPGDYPYGNGPQGDVVRVFNYVRCVRGSASTPTTTSTTTTTTTLPALCGSVPESACRLAASGKALVQYKDKTPDTKDQFKWKWRKGAPTGINDLADPITGSAAYSVCVYDASAGTQPLMESHLLPGGSCSDKPCWRTSGTSGFKYKDRQGTPDGIISVKLREGTAGKAQIQIKSKGENIAMPTLGLTNPVVVQFLIDNGIATECWQTTYTTSLKNEASQYKAKGP